MTTRHVKKYHRVSVHRSRAEAEAKARRLKAQGKNVRVRRDPLTGNWIVELIVLTAVLGLSLGLLGAFHR